MAIFLRIGRFISEFITPVEATDYLDTIAYRREPQEGELRFSRINALRRHY
jgi:hypothetical protein